MQPLPSPSPKFSKTEESERSQEKLFRVLKRDTTERASAEEILHEISSRGLEPQLRKVLQDCCVIGILSAAVFVVGDFTGFFDWAFHYVDSHDRGSHGFWDEAIGTLMFVCLALVGFSYRRWKESRRETLSQTQISETLGILNKEMEAQVRQRTTQLVQTNKDLRSEIAERKQAVESLKLFRTLMDRSNDAIEVIDAQTGRFLDVNETACRRLGYSRNEMLSLGFPDIIDTGEHPFSLRDAVAEIRKTGFRIVEARHRRKDGSTFPIEVNAQYIDLNGGYLISVVRDITERKRAQEQIAEQAALLDKTQDAILVRDLEGKILFWNKGAETIYGWTREEVVGRNMDEYLYANPKKFEDINEVTIDQGECHRELRHLTKDHREIIVEARWTLIRDNEGHPKSVLTVYTDITEKKKVEAQFMRAQRMESIGTLAGGIAHDLNNILAPIMMSIDILKTVSEDPQATKILETIGVSAKRGADIVRQVLSFARGLEGERIEVQPKHLLKDLENIIKGTFPQDIRLQFSIPNDTWTILGDPTQVHQILLNLSVNARDAMPNGGSLTIGVTNAELDEQYASMNIQAKPGRYVVINVTDSGTGMPQNIIDKIFDPFFTTKDINKGTGLGLSTVMAIVKSHEGIINVYSEPDKGTTFKVYLPAVETSSEMQKMKSERTSLPRGNGETVLVVDDEASILAISSQTLQAFGYRVLTATDGAEAVATYAKHMDEIAVILTDMAMPIMDGPATIHALMRINPQVKIIAASGLHANGDVAKASGQGVRNFLTKPYTAATLLKTMRAILDETKTV